MISIGIFEDNEMSRKRASPMSKLTEKVLRKGELLTRNHLDWIIS